MLSQCSLSIAEEKEIRMLCRHRNMLYSDTTHTQALPGQPEVLPMSKDKSGVLAVGVLFFSVGESYIGL